MDAGLLGAFGTVTAFVAFLAVVVWAYGKGAKPGFDAASRLPLEDEERRASDEGDRR